MKKILKQKGFTLVEMMVSMAIFVAFIGILITSYTGIVRAQREANEYRIMYVEARRVFETLVAELRDGMVDYGKYPALQVPSGILQEINLISKDATIRTYVSYDDSANRVKIAKSKIVPGVKPCVNANYASFGDGVELNTDEVKVTEFFIYVSPVIDPYDLENVYKDGSQFHPKVTIYAKFEREGVDLPIDLQTTVSSRIYNQVYSTDQNECNLYNL